MRISKLLILFITLIIAGCSASIPSRPEEIKVSEPQFTPPKIERWTMKNGLEVYLLEDHELPLFSGDFYFRFGTLTETDLPKGLVEAMMSQLRSGGIAGSTPQQLDAELDAVGASIEGAGGGEFSSISFFSHRSDAELIFSKLKGLIRQPAFDPARLNIWKSQAIDSIDRRREDPETIANATFATALYGENSVYSSLPTKASINQITSKSLRTLSHNKLLPDGATLAVTGDITRPDLEAMLEKYLGGWEGKANNKEVAPPPTFTPKPGLYFVDANFQQSAVIIGQSGPARLSPDQYSLSVLNRYFSRGAFGSVLFTEVRSKRGFAYTVDGGFAPGAKTGEFAVDMGTRGEVTEQAVREVVRQIGIVRNEVPPKERIDDVKKAVKQGFIFNFAKPSNALTREVMLNLLGYPKDFNQTYIANISNVSPEEVRQTATSRLAPENLIVVVVGKLDGKSLAKNLNLPFYQVEFNTVPKIRK